MRERYDPKTEDIFLFLSPEELTEFNQKGIGEMRLVIPEKSLAFFLFSDAGSGERADNYIRVNVAYDVQNFTNFYIYLSERAVKDLLLKRECHDRYSGTIGSQKVHIFVEAPVVK